MTTGTVQTTFSNDNPIAKAGMVLSDSPDTRQESLPCGAAALDFGVTVELVGGLLVVAQGTGNPDASVVRGVTCYRDTLEGPAAGASTLPYQPGDNVLILRKGIIAAQCVSGTTVTPGAPCNFSHSSTLAGNNGLITSAAVSGTAGSEISAFPNGSGTFWKKDLGLASATVPLAAIEVNFP